MDRNATDSLNKQEIKQNRKQDKKRRKNTLLRLLKYGKPYTLQLTVAMVVTLLLVVMNLYIPNLFGQIIDLFEANAPYGRIVKLGIVYAVVLVISLACSIMHSWFLQYSGQHIVFNMRNEVFAHIQKLHLGYFDVTPVGRLVTRVTNDVEAISELFSNIIVHFVEDVVTIIGLAVVMLLLNWRIALRAFILVPIIALLTFVFRKVSRTCYRITRSKITALNTYLSEHLSGMKLIQIFNRENVKNREFENKSRELFRAYFREVMVFAIFRPAIYMLSIFALVNIVYGGSEQVFANMVDEKLGITVGMLYMFIQYVNQFFDPIQELSELIGTLQQSLASAEKIFTILDEDPAIVNPDEPKLVEGRIRGEIVFDHVWFAYSGEDWILKDVSFKIEPGKRVAFVGATGAGKTTILSLVGRYYDIQKGRILVDGIDIRDMSLEQLRSAIGQVQQDVFIFTGSIAGNIKLLNENISDEKMMEAARTANADTFIRNLEKGYEEAVTERGSTLSAGQRQLLSFARTLAYDPAILVMDEATANIDTETEQLITEALERMMNGRTTIMVAHRLSTIQHCDCIMVMHKGRLREQGTHQELLEQNGIYKKLYEIQLRTAR